MGTAVSPVCIRRRFDVSVETLFDAWLDPMVMRRWMFKSPTNEISIARVEQREGGSFSIVENASGRTIDHFGHYRRIDWDRTLVFTLEVPGHFPGVSCVSVQILPETAHRSVLTFVQTGVDKALVEDMWRKMFDTLSHVLSEAKAPPVKIEDSSRLECLRVA